MLRRGSVRAVSFSLYVYTSPVGTFPPSQILTSGYPDHTLPRHTKLLDLAVDHIGVKLQSATLPSYLPSSSP